MKSDRIVDKFIDFWTINDFSKNEQWQLWTEEVLREYEWCPDDIDMLEDLGFKINDIDEYCRYAVINKKLIIEDEFGTSLIPIENLQKVIDSSPLYKEITKYPYGYKCTECKSGTIERTVIHEYVFAVGGGRIPTKKLVVEDAIIGVCNMCQLIDIHYDEWNRVLLQVKNLENWK